MKEGVAGFGVIFLIMYSGALMADGSPWSAVAVLVSTLCVANKWK